MLTIFGSHHIPTNRCVLGHRACRTHTGFFLGAGEVRRVQNESIAIVNRRLRRQWLEEAWVRHLSCCAQKGRMEYPMKVTETGSTEVIAN